MESMEATPKPARNYNEELVVMINDLKAKRDNVGKEIEIESRKRNEILAKIDEESKRMALCETRLSKLQQVNQAYTQMVDDAEAAYKKIEESSQTLLHVMKRENKAIQNELTGTS
jgi:Sjoegren syndrome nuclear autoantigen 1